jgi:hypothetical protein
VAEIGFLAALTAFIALLAVGVVRRGLIGLAQLAIGLAMLAGYRRSGVWGAF